MSSIEREYRDALDGLRFSGVGKERIMKGLMEAEKVPVKGKHFCPLRPVLIAAVLCLALVGTAVGARIFRVNVDLHTDPAHPGDNYTVTGGIAFFPADSFPQQVHDLAAEFATVKKNPGKSFESWAELEEFLGRELPHSAVLASADEGFQTRLPGSGGNTSILSIQLWAHAVDQGFATISTSARYVQDGISIQESALIYTDKAEQNHKEYGREGEEFQGGIVMVYDEGSEMTEETYTTPGGLTAAIVEVKPVPDAFLCPTTEYNAHFSMDGIQYTLTASTYAVGMTAADAAASDDPAHTLDVLKTVLDGFVLE